MKVCPLILESLCLPDLWTLHSNECFFLFAILYLVFLIKAQSSAHIYHLTFSESHGMLTVQQRLLFLNSSSL